MAEIFNRIIVTISSKQTFNLSVKKNASTLYSLLPFLLRAIFYAHVRVCSDCVSDR